MKVLLVLFLISGCTSMIYYGEIETAKESCQYNGGFKAIDAGPFSDEYICNNEMRGKF